MSDVRAVVNRMLAALEGSFFVGEVRPGPYTVLYGPEVIRVLGLGPELPRNIEIYPEKEEVRVSNDGKEWKYANPECGLLIFCLLDPRFLALRGERLKVVMERGAERVRGEVGRGCVERLLGAHLLAKTVGERALHPFVKVPRFDISLGEGARPNFLRVKSAPPLGETVEVKLLPMVALPITVVPSIDEFQRIVTYEPSRLVLKSVPVAAI